MKFFLDTANIAEIREVASTGILDGITTTLAAGEVVRHQAVVDAQHDDVRPFHALDTVHGGKRHFGRRGTFVLSTSGHVQSIVRPPRRGE